MIEAALEALSRGLITKESSECGSRGDLALLIAARHGRRMRDERVAELKSMDIDVDVTTINSTSSEESNLEAAALWYLSYAPHKIPNT